MRVLVTGGSRGIGGEIVRHGQANGWSMRYPPRKFLDLSDIGSIRKFLAKENSWDFDAVVFCHGTWYSVPVYERLRSQTHWLDQYRERVAGPMYMIDNYIAADAVRNFVMVSSTRGFIGGVDTGPYAAACAAQIALMQGYAREWPDARFNVVCPGWTDTDMGREVRQTGGGSGEPQNPYHVVCAAIDMLENDCSGYVLRVVDGETRLAVWDW